MKQNFFFKRKEIWVPTWKTILLTLALLITTTIATIKLTPPFLSPHAPIHARVLVLEGWIDEHGLQTALRLSTNYDLIISGGGPIQKGLVYSDYGTFANLGAQRLRKLGYTGTNLVAVPSAKALRDRTYHSALAIRQYLLKNTNYRALDVISGGVHTRRSWLLYQMACSPDIHVGVYSGPDVEFDPKRWYRTSAGVRSVLSESIAYLYAKFLFNPPPPSNSLPHAPNSSPPQ